MKTEEQQEENVTNKITKWGGFILTLVVSLIYCVMYINNIDRRVAILETNQAHVTPVLEEIKGDINKLSDKNDKLNDKIDKIYVLMPKSKKDEILS